MAQITIARPQPNEYVPAVSHYMERVPEGDVLDMLTHQIDDTLGLVSALSEHEADFAYAPGKWSFKEVIGHLSDTERVLSYRAVAFARGEPQPLPGFDENLYVANANFRTRTLADLMAELRAVRASTVALFASLDPAMLDRRGTANNREYTVRALASFIAGHERHHAAIFRERYLPALRAG